MDDTEPHSLILASITPMSELDYTFWIGLIILFILLISSALISGSEVAFFSLNPSEKQQIKEEKSEKSNTVLQLLKEPRKLLATILVANNFINVSIVILSSYLFILVYPDTDTEFEKILRGIIEIVGITFLILLIGEVIPKVYANKNSVKLIYIMTKPIDLIGKTPPFSWLKNILANGTEIILKYTRKKSLDVSTDDLENALALTRESDTTENERKILEGIINFGNTDVKQIMTSRVDSIAVPYDASYEELMEIILDAGYSRIPVFKETFDEVVGIIYVKDLLPYLNQKNDFEWNKLIRQPFFVPENKKIDDLLKEFQTKKVHLAVVVDEYGGASGIVTLEDILEEIVGEITDEFDDDEIIYSKIDENTYLFEGKTALIDLYKVLDIDGKPFEEAKGESDSIAGFLIEQSGKLLKKNEKLDFQNISFVIEAADKKRVKLIKVILNQNTEKTNDEG